MRKFIAMALIAIGTIAAGAASTACIFWAVEEAKTPDSLL